MTDQLKNIFIGLFVVAAATIIVSMILFLKPTVGDGKQHIRVRFTNIAGMNIGTRVTFAGKPVGEVVAIQEIEDARQRPTDEAGRVYFYELLLKVDSSASIYNTDEVAIRTTGLMGEKSIAILPRAASPGTIPKEITHEMIYANSIDPLENTFNQMTKVATRLQTAVEHWDTWFKENRQHASEAIASFASSMQSTQDIMKEIAEGKGTIGRFLSTDDMYLRFSSLFSKAEVLMNDLNHYGLLFQYDKRWQRSRTQKANALKSLQSPQEFQAYFASEVSTIATSLSRLTELLEKAQETAERSKIIQSEGFKRDFAALLRQSQSLTDSIKLYNEGLMAEEALEGQ